MPVHSQEVIQISRTRRIGEITAVTLTAAGKFLFMDYLQWRSEYVLVAVVVWAVYIVFRQIHKPGILKYWGFRTDNFIATAGPIWPIALLSVIAFFMIGHYQGTINMSWHLIPVLMFYPLWGTIQQFLLIALVAGNLQGMQERIPVVVIILSSAILFALVHYPIRWLMGGTFLLALFYGYVYLHQKNLYVLGIFHGWLGALFYYTVLNKDPFQEAVEKLF